MLLGRFAHWGPAGRTWGTIVLRESRDAVAIFMLRTFCAGTASCSYSGNKGQRAHVKKRGDFLGLPISASETKIFLSFQQNLCST